MTNNDIFRRIRYAMGLDNVKVINIFSLEGQKVTQGNLNTWLKKEKEEGYVEMDDKTLAYFLNGLISSKRG